VNVGILGGGNISATHARAVAGLAGCRVAAVWGARQDVGSRIAAEHSAPFYADLDRFLDHRPMDLVAIGSPSGLHAQHATAAAGRGLHVLVEKPLDISTQRIDTLLQDIARAGVTLGVIFQDRLKPDLLRLKQLLEQGELGRMLLASARVKWYRPPDYYSASRWRGTWALDGGGALMNQGIHTVDVLRWLLGPVLSVTAATGTLLHAIEVEDTAVATLRFANGALATLEAATSAYPGFPRRIELTGAAGTLVVEGDTLTTLPVREAADAGLAPPPARTASDASPVVADATAHRRVVADFIEAIRTGRKPACDGDEGRHSVAIVEAIYESARSGAACQPR
jgi:predicted dehydrogenase